MPIVCDWLVTRRTTDVPDPFGPRWFGGCWKREEASHVSIGVYQRPVLCDRCGTGSNLLAVTEAVRPAQLARDEEWDHWPALFLFT
jgi:hypothetical protein